MTWGASRRQLLVEVPLRALLDKKRGYLLGIRSR